MERARRDEKHMVGLHGAMFGGDRGPFDQGQQVPLHPLSADIAANPLFARFRLYPANYAEQFAAGGVVYNGEVEEAAGVRGMAAWAELCEALVAEAG